MRFPSIDCVLMVAAHAASLCVLIAMAVSGLRMMAKPAIPYIFRVLGT